MLAVLLPTPNAAERVGKLPEETLLAKTGEGGLDGKVVNAAVVVVGVVPVLKIPAWGFVVVVVMVVTLANRLEGRLGLLAWSEKSTELV